VPILTVPTPSIIIAPNEVCPTGNQTVYIEAPRVGCIYTWSVDAPMFIVGSNVGESIVVNINGAVITDQIHVEELCPITPTNYQLIAPCNELHDDSWWWIIGNDIEYSRNRLLKNVVEDFVEFLCPEITTVRSDFFQWNPLNPSLINYVYGGINEYNYLTIAQKSDIRLPGATEGATIGNLTWSQLVEWFANIEVYYLIINGELHIEHISRFLNNPGLDLTQQPFDEFSRYQNRYTYAKEEMARREEYKFMEAQNADFVGFPIEYKDINGDYSLCVNDETEEHKFDKLTTDLKYIQTDNTAIANEGFVILANTFDGVDYHVITNNGFISGFPILNSPMSIALLQERFIKWNRILLFGNMNRQFTNFESAQYFKKQEKFKIPLCCGTNFNPINLIKTFLGVGQVDTAEIDYKDDTMEIKIKYE